MPSKKSTAFFSGTARANTRFTSSAGSVFIISVYNCWRTASAFCKKRVSPAATKLASAGIIPWSMIFLTIGSAFARYAALSPLLSVQAALRSATKAFFAGSSANRPKTSSRVTTSADFKSSTNIADAIC